MSLIAQLSDLIAAIGDNFKSDRARLADLEAFDFESGTFAPELAFVTPGDLSVSYSRQNGYYSRLGKMVLVSIDLICVPSYSTASGRARVTGLPHASVVGATQNLPLYFGNATSWDDDDTMTYGQIPANQTYIDLYSIGSGSPRSDIDESYIVSGSTRVLRLNGAYQLQ